jgi:hypothetical protein
MSSCQRFLRQIAVSSQLVVDASTLRADALDFVPLSGNVVGNYPPGYMVPADVTGLGLAISNALSGPYAGAVVLRDMGKTVFAQYSATVGGSLTSAPAGFYRQYQVLLPQNLTAAQGFIGGSNGSTFGVAGPGSATSPGTSTYLTVYLPSIVAGVVAPGVNAYEAPVVSAGGQL